MITEGNRKCFLLLDCRFLPKTFTWITQQFQLNCSTWNSKDSNDIIMLCKPRGEKTDETGLRFTKGDFPQTFPCATVEFQ